MIHPIKFIQYFFIILPFLVVSCIKDDFSIGKENLKTNMRVIITDTCSVKMTTYQDDSIITNALGYAWIGNYTDKDNFFGTITATSFVPFSLPSFNPDTSARFDSIALIVKFSPDYYGDTIPIQNIYVHRVTSQIALRASGHLYNISSFPYKSDENLATISFAPRPSLKKTISISATSPNPLYNFGKALFDKFMKNDSDVINDDKFSKYFSGLAFVPDSLNGKLINSLVAGDSIPLIRIYYHYFSSNKTNSTIDITPNSALQFNNVTQKGSRLGRLSGLNKQIVSTATNNHAYIQGMTGTHIKIELPYLKDFGTVGEFVEITGAQMLFEPVKGTFVSNTPLPDTLQYNVLDESGNSVFQLQAFQNIVPYIYLSKDVIHYDENTQYGFDITNYLRFNNQLAAFGINKIFFTLSSLPIQGRKNPLRRLIFGDQQNLKGQLKIEFKLMVYEGQ
jgi:hypothetical protein